MKSQTLVLKFLMTLRLLITENSKLYSAGTMSLTIIIRLQIPCFES